ncbi:hypothetical protein ALI22I_20430 [Saccharothrix sp. ALI-22-I]|nr:hypothetical protein ALI22I_20430 [Saccharothrix sp. ALI-22-I]
MLDASRYEIVECASRINVFYAAVRTKETGEVWALVVLVQRGRGQYNFGYKDMSESMGPVQADAPAKVLDVLTSTDSEYALAWRQRCRDNLAKSAAARNRQRSVTAGVVIQVATPIPFKNGRSVSRFKCVERGGRKIRWQALPDDDAVFYCNLGAHWARRYTWKIVQTEPPQASGLPAASETS